MMITLLDPLYTSPMIYVNLHIALTCSIIVLLDDNDASVMVKDTCFHFLTVRRVVTALTEEVLLVGVD